jgi:hypothetical protein
MDQNRLHISEGYYINLKSRLDRRQHMEKLISNLGWPIQHFSAIHLDLDPAKYDLNMRPRLRGARAVASIWLSHLAVMEKFIDSPHEGNFLLLEDDVFIRKHLWGKNNIPCSGLPDAWDIILFSPRYKLRHVNPGSVGAPKFVDPPFGFDKPNFLPEVTKTHFCTGAHFCVIRDRAAARRIHARMKSSSQIYDVDEFYAAEALSYGISSPFITAGGFGSDHI